MDYNKQNREKPVLNIHNFCSETETGNQTAVDESQEANKNQTPLGHMGENPTPFNNQTLLGHKGENPTVPAVNQSLAENSTNALNSTLLGRRGENPMVAKLNPVNDSTKVKKI